MSENRFIPRFGVLSENRTPKTHSKRTGKNRGLKALYRKRNKNADDR